jgi:hypothetical protein
MVSTSDPYPENSINIIFVGSPQICGPEEDIMQLTKLSVRYICHSLTIFQYLIILAGNLIDWYNLQYYSRKYQAIITLHTFFEEIRRKCRPIRNMRRIAQYRDSIPWVCSVWDRCVGSPNEQACNREARYGCTETPAPCAYNFMIYSNCKHSQVMTQKYHQRVVFHIVSVTIWIPTRSLHVFRLHRAEDGVSKQIHSSNSVRAHYLTDAGVMVWEVRILYTYNGNVKHIHMSSILMRAPPGSQPWGLYPGPSQVAPLLRLARQLLVPHRVELSLQLMAAHL